MKKRWIFRGIVLLLLAVCVTVWVASYWGGMRVQGCRGGRFLQVIAVEGVGYMGEDGSVPFRDSPFRFSFEHGARAKDLLDMSTTTWSFGGIFRNLPVSGYIIFPFWLPTLPSALLLWFVWRKTRARPVGRGFPVEPAKSGEQQP
jgi:hypothetical protein